MDGWMKHGQTEARIDGGWTPRQAGWKDWWLDRQVNGCNDESTVWMDAWMNGHRGKDGWTDGWMPLVSKGRANGGRSTEAQVGIRGGGRERQVVTWPPHSHHPHTHTTPPPFPGSGDFDCDQPFWRDAPRSSFKTLGGAGGADLGGTSAPVHLISGQRETRARSPTSSVITVPSLHAPAERHNGVWLCRAAAPPRARWRSRRAESLSCRRTLRVYFRHGGEGGEWEQGLGWGVS